MFKIWQSPDFVVGNFCKPNTHQNLTKCAWSCKQVAKTTKWVGNCCRTVIWLVEKYTALIDALPTYSHPLCARKHKSSGVQHQSVSKTRNKLNFIYFDNVNINILSTSTASLSPAGLTLKGVWDPDCSFPHAQGRTEMNKTLFCAKLFRSSIAVHFGSRDWSTHRS